MCAERAWEAISLAAERDAAQEALDAALRVLAGVTGEQAATAAHRNRTTEGTSEEGRQAIVATSHSKVTRKFEAQ